MKKILFLLVIYIVSGPIQSNAQNFWRIISDIEKNERSFPSSDLPEMPMAVYELDIENIKKYLTNAPEEFSEKDGIRLNLPVGDGGFEEFAVYYSPVMEKELADKYPQIRSFTGKSGMSNIVHLGYDTRGFYAYMEVNDVIYVIDNYKQGNDQLYSAYKKNDYPSEIWNSFKCDNKDHDHEHIGDRVSGRSSGESVSFRTFRIAVAATTQYCNRFGGTTATVMEEINKAINRINLIFRRDLSASLIIIANNEVLLDLNSNFFTNGNTQEMIDENPLFFQIKGITLDEFDIGHVLGTNGGGLAQLYSLCAASWSKARGVSTWANVVGDPFHVNVVAHELGHQFGSPHSFNNCNDGGNENNSTGFEPGSGHTIMSYHSLCGPDNVAGESIDMYNFYSLEVMYDFLTNGNASECGEIVANVNTRPTVTILSPGAVTIPISTPFKLVGQATDNETPELLTYSWEQANIGPLSPLGSPQGNAPSFRVFPPSSVPVRYLPQLPSLFQGVNTREEILPTYTRDFTFRLVVRDNDPNGGAFIQDEISFKSTNLAGPFRLTTSFNGKSYTEGEIMLVEWDVANTDKAPVNCHFVNILVTNDGGQTFTMLAENVLNTGRAEVEVPKINSTSCRLFIEAADNIFFTTHTGIFSISESDDSSLSIVPEKYGYQVCTPQIVEVPFTVSPIGDFNGTADIEMISPLPLGVFFDFNKTTIEAEDEVTAVVRFTHNVETSEKIELDIRIILSTDDTLFRKIQFDIVTPIPYGVEAVRPADGTTGVNANPVISWTSSENAESYTFKLYSLDGSVEIERVTSDTFFVVQQLLPPAMTYYWTVGVNNRCFSSGDNSYFNVYSFTTVFTDCREYSATSLPAIISAGAPNVVEVLIEVPDNVTISDVNVPKVIGSHAATSQLTTTLVSPDEDGAILFGSICGTLANWNFNFDDDLNTGFLCTHPPGTPTKSHHMQLNKFNGKNSQGTWKVLFNDRMQGAGGRVDEVVLEICAAFPINHPQLIVNNHLEVPTLKHQTITTDHLQAIDSDNDDSELRFIVLDLPKKGHLEFYGGRIYQNGYFTQSSVNDFGVVYYHTGDESDTYDSFRFIIVDGAGGYYGTGTFDIIIDPDFTVSNSPREQNLEFKVFPNPARDLFYVQIQDTKNAGNEYVYIDIFSVNGSVLRTHKFQGGLNRHEISTAGLASGIYLVKVTTPSYSGIKKIVIN